MGNPYPATFIDGNSEGRLVGQLDFTDANNQPGASAEPFNYYQGAPTSVPSGGFGTALDWHAFSVAGEGTQPFNLTDPTTPVVLANGNYTITVEASWYDGPAAAGKRLVGLLYLDVDGVDDGPAATTSMEAASALVSVTQRRYLAAGMKIQAVANQDSGSPQNIYLWAAVSRAAT